MIFSYVLLIVVAFGLLQAFLITRCPLGGRIADRLIKKCEEREALRDRDTPELRVWQSWT